MPIRTLEEAREWRKKQETGAAELFDREASMLVDLYPPMRYDGKLIEVGTRIKWKDKLKRASVALWDREENNPDNAPALWEDVLYADGVRVIVENMPAALAFSYLEEGWWRNQVYISQMHGNVYTPVTAPEQWKLKEN